MQGTRPCYKMYQWTKYPLIPRPIGSGVLTQSSPVTNGRTDTMDKTSVAHTVLAYCVSCSYSSFCTILLFTIIFQTQRNQCKYKSQHQLPRSLATKTQKIGATAATNVRDRRILLCDSRDPSAAAAAVPRVRRAVSHSSRESDAITR